MFEWRHGFASAGFGMAIGLVTYLAGLPLLPRDPTPPRDKARGEIADGRPRLAPCPIRPRVCWESGFLFSACHDSSFG
ncbi:MAG TPA: hypothetical protein VIF34_16675 [Methylocystis sp.]